MIGTLRHVEHMSPSHVDREIVVSVGDGTLQMVVQRALTVIAKDEEPKLLWIAVDAETEIELFVTQMEGVAGHILHIHHVLAEMVLLFYIDHRNHLFDEEVALLLHLVEAVDWTVHRQIYVDHFDNYLV